ncbi:MAG: hypothetical protein QOE41_672 [Mycobacterium sp.]|nr:hypothetical protein [Mycobacterium sp.]
MLGALAEIAGVDQVWRADAQLPAVRTHPVPATPPRWRRGVPGGTAAVPTATVSVPSTAAASRLPSEVKSAEWNPAPAINSARAASMSASAALSGSTTLSWSHRQDNTPSGRNRMGFGSRPHRCEPRVIIDADRDQHRVGLAFADRVRALVSPDDAAVLQGLLVEKLAAGRLGRMNVGGAPVSCPPARSDGPGDPPARLRRQRQRDGHGERDTDPADHGARDRRRDPAKVGSRVICLSLFFDSLQAPTTRNIFIHSVGGHRGSRRATHRRVLWRAINLAIDVN